MKTPEEATYRSRVGYQAALLGGFSSLATILLVMGNFSTKDVIQLRQQEDLLSSLSEVIPAAYYSNNLVTRPLQLTLKNGQVNTFYRGIKDQQISAIAWEITGQGYGGEMRFIMAVDKDGKILGVRALAHAETPGLGDKMEVAKDNWILKFNGLSLGNPPEAQWQVKKDGGQFDAFTGATITPRGVVRAVVTALKYFREHRKELLTRAKQAELKPETAEKTGDNSHD